MLSKRVIYYIVVLLLASAGFIFSEAIAQRSESVVLTDSIAYKKFVSSKKVVCDTSDETSFRNIVDKALNARFQDLDFGERVRKVGELFLGIPYVDKTLDVDSASESLVCNLRGFDCVTFFENTLAISRLIGQRDRSFEAFQSELLNSRYRDGRLIDYASRLHYTSEYFFDNARRGSLREVTREIGGKKAVLETKAINFMSLHPASYKQLADNMNLRMEIEEAENKLNARGGFYYIKKQDVASIEAGIRDGDIIGITTSVGGLDASHTGIAVRGADGRIHLMHASLTMKKVIVGEEPLADYLAGNSKQTGIMIYRPIEPLN